MLRLNLKIEIDHLVFLKPTLSFQTQILIFI